MSAHKIGRAFPSNTVASFVEGTDEGHVLPAAFENSCGEARWRLAALQQQQSLVVLRDLNAALLEENSWLREYILSSKEPFSKEHCDTMLRSPRQLPTAQQPNKAQSHLYACKSLVSPAHETGAQCSFSFEKPPALETASCCPEGRTRIPTYARSARLHNESSVREEPSREDGLRCSCLRNVSACKGFQCCHMLRAASWADASAQTSICHAASVSSCCCRAVQAVRPQTCRSATPETTKSAEPFAEQPRIPTRRSVRIYLDKQEETSVMEQCRDKARTTKRNCSGCRDGKVLKHILEAHSNADHTLCCVERKEVLGRSLACRSCLHLLSMASKWAQCAAVLEVNRLKDLEEIARLERHISWLQDDRTTCCSWKTSPAGNASANNAPCSTYMPASVLLGGNVVQAEYCTYRRSLELPQSVTVSVEGRNDISSVEALLRTPTPYNHILDAATNCQFN